MSKPDAVDKLVDFILSDDRPVGPDDKADVEMFNKATDWRDAETYRKPKWPVGGYAPGKYGGKCIICGGRFLNMDKRAVTCFPCAVESMCATVEEMRASIRRLERENETLRSTISIVSAPSPFTPDRR